MIGWTLRAAERWARANPRRLDAVMERLPDWFIPRLARAKLARSLRYVWDRSSAQRERWRAAGVRRRDLDAGALERIPFTTSDDLAERPDDFLCVPRAEAFHVIGSSGTRGRAKRIHLTSGDLERQLSVKAAFLTRLEGARAVGVLYPIDDPTWSAGILLRVAAEKARLPAFLSAAHRPLDDQIALIREFGINVLFANAPFFIRLTQEAGTDLRSLDVRYLCVGAQAWTEETRAMLQSAWGARALDTYGMAELGHGIAAECVRQNGLHLSETDLWPEIVDPATGRTLSAGDEGELVLTTLSRRGMPLVRYRTGDLASLFPSEERCPCGWPLRRMSRVRGRVDDMIIVGGGNIYPDEIDRAVFSVAGVSDYQIVLGRRGPRETLELTVEAPEENPATAEAARRALLDNAILRVTHLLQKTLDIDPVRIVAPGTLSAGRVKTPRIIDRRPEYASIAGTVPTSGTVPAWPSHSRKDAPA